MDDVQLPPNMKRCPACGIIIEKVDGDATMMCGCEGRPAGGTPEKALRNGGCGHEFNWNTLAPLGGGAPGAPSNARQVHFGAFDGNGNGNAGAAPVPAGNGSAARRQAAEALEFTGFALDLRVAALEQNRDDPERAVDWLFQHGQKYQANQDLDRAAVEAARAAESNRIEGQAAQMAALGFGLDECKQALRRHNNNMESAVNWLVENAGVAEAAAGGRRAPHNPEAVMLEQVRVPKVGIDTIAANSRPDALALEVTRQEMLEDPTMFQGENDIQCYRCGGTGVRQGLDRPESASAETAIAEAVAGEIVVPQVPYRVPLAEAHQPLMPSDEVGESKYDDNLDRIPVAVVLRVSSGDHDGGALRRATSLERWLEHGEDNDDARGSGGGGGGMPPSDSISLKAFSAEELGLLRGAAPTTPKEKGAGGGAAAAAAGGIRRTQSRRKIKQVSRNQSHHLDLARYACWVCEGTGKLSKYFGSLDVAACTGAGEETPKCGICWCDPAEYGLSTTCAHVYCQGCLKGHLETAMNEGKFPSFCPSCAAAAGGDGSEPPCGKIDGATLSFLAQRGVITHEFQFRFMRQQKEIERQFFGCPANCGRILLEPEEVKWLGDRNAPYMAPGECVCGAACCVTCHQLLVPGEIRSHDCPASKAGADMTAEELLLLHNRGIRKCPRCSTFIQKNEGCHIMVSVLPPPPRPPRHHITTPPHARLFLSRGSFLLLLILTRFVLFVGLLFSDVWQQCARQH